jgi:ferric-dicitrate binding protein FerR (iron transport regulator)
MYHEAASSDSSLFAEARERIVGVSIMRRLPQILLPAILVILATPVSASHAAGSHQVATVKTIRGGLTVMPPQALSRPGWIKQPLFAAYGLLTGARQRASLRFTDGSVIFINQRTSLILRSPHLTVLKRGEAVFNDTSGQGRTVVTSSAVAAATGTIFDVFITAPSPALAPRRLLETTKTFPRGTTTVSVVTGTVIVSNRFGSVRVLPGHWTHVAPGSAPTQPTRHHARDDVAWRRRLAP